MLFRPDLKYLCHSSTTLLDEYAYVREDAEKIHKVLLDWRALVIRRDWIG